MADCAAWIWKTVNLIGWSWIGHLWKLLDLNFWKRLHLLFCRDKFFLLVPVCWLSSSDHVRPSCDTFTHTRLSWAGSKNWMACPDIVYVSSTLYILRSYISLKWHILCQPPGVESTLTKVVYLITVLTYLYYTRAYPPLCCFVTLLHHISEGKIALFTILYLPGICSHLLLHRLKILY